MRLSTKARYGLRLCFLIGLNEGKTTALSSLVKQTDLSEKYLEQILSKLKKGGVIQSKRGISGGYCLAAPPQQITLKDIFGALDNEFQITDCVTDDCDDHYCPNKRIFKKIYDEIDAVLTKTSIADMIDDYRCKV